MTNGDILDFNVCGQANRNCPNKTAMATYTIKATNQCISLTGSNVLFSTYNINYDNTTNITTLQSVLPVGDTCKTNLATNYSLTYTFVCNANATTPIISAATFNINSCSNVITITTNQACPEFDIYGLWNAIMNNKYAFGTLILVAGFIFCFFGKKFLFFTEIMTGVVVALFFVLYFILSNVSFAMTSWQFWLIVIGCCLIGALCGYLISLVTNLAAIILAACCGYVLGNFLYTIALKYIQSNPTAVYWTVMSVSIIGCALLGWWLADQIIIIATSILGAYGVMRGAAFMIGYFPDERQVYQLMQNKEWDQVNALFTWQVYVYFVFFILLAIAGIYVQEKYFSESAEKQREEEKKNEPLVQK